MRAFKIWLILMAWVAALVLFAQAARSETMVASFYGAESGHRTASGEVFHPMGMTAAHRTLAFGTRLKVCRGERCVSVRVTDRGPARWTRRDLDLSKGAAVVIGLVGPGVGRVDVEQE